MDSEKRRTLRIDINYGGVQCLYMMYWCTLNAFTTVYLTYKGFSNIQIGWATSILSAIVIGLQIVLGNYCDRHPNVAIKRVISVMLICAMVLAAALRWMYLPMALMTVVFVLASSFSRSTDALINALMMQFVNAGENVHYGITRGIGSLSYALSAYALGIIIADNTPDIIMPIFLVTAAAAIVLIMFMPAPKKRMLTVAHEGEKLAPEKVPTYGEMLSKNKVLCLYLVAAIFSAIGKNAALGTFFIRVIEDLGGGTKELGICSFIQAVVELPMMTLSPFILKKIDAEHLLVISFTCDGLKILAVLLARSLTVLYIALSFSFLCFGIYGFASVIFINSIVGDAEKARAQTFIQLTNYVGSIAGNALAGVMIDGLGMGAVLLMSVILCLSAGATQVVCCREIRRKERAAAAA